jgi:gamma-glutamylcyclotransferase (GGCT)/AIG2-like uncharacterized protein YtfP
LAGGDKIVEAADAYFRALNKLWNVFGLPLVEGDRGDATLFAILLKAGMSSDHKKMLLRSIEVQGLAGLEPPILNHAELNRARWRPGSEIKGSLRRAATEDHRRLRSGLDRYANDAEEEQTVLKKLANVLYVVRSNIAHGEKTFYGPDLGKRFRDETVCRCVVPVQKLMVNLLLERPEERLLAYGTLAPGGANHGIVGHLHGRWRRCTVRGRVSEHAGYPRFRWDPSGPELSTNLLESSELPAAWSDIDRFEGVQCARHLVPAQAGESSMVVYAYESATA